jgi:hypothetical protein
MFIRKKIQIDNKSVSVYDDVFSFQENLEIYQFICQQPFIRSNLDNTFQNNKDIDIKWSCLLKESNQISNLLEKKYLNLDELKDRRIEIFRQYVNFSTSEAVDQIHVDSPADSSNAYTILHYANFIWDKNWHGETVFYNYTADEIALSTMIRPGRVVVFDSNIPHSARPPSRISEYGRYIIATKLLIL